MLLDQVSDLRERRETNASRDRSHKQNKNNVKEKHLNEGIHSIMSILV